ncbi:MAG: VWA domain-containing protein [Acidobacteriota bacterium]
MRSGRTALVIVALGGAIVSSFALQRQPASPPQYKVAVKLVTLDVVVTDRKGAYPPGLRREDFLVFEDGVPQQVQDFRWVHAEPPGEPGTAAGPAAGSGPMRTPEPPRLFLLMVDNLNSQWANLHQVSEALEKLFSDSLLPQDLLAVMTVSHSAGLLQTFTGDREALRTASRKALGLSLQGTMAASSAARAIRDAAAAPSMFESACLFTGLPESLQIDMTAWDDAARIFATQNDYSARGSLHTLESVCKSLAALKGRKTIILISEGFAASDPVAASLPRVLDAANKANVAIYAINPRGLEQYDPGQPITFSQAARARTFQSTGSVVAGNSSFDIVRMENRANSLEDSLGELAVGTGGVTLRNSNEFLKGLKRAVDDGHSYYELTYVPKNQAVDGRFRRIEVRLSAALKDYSVRTRRGYHETDAAGPTAVSAEARMSQELYSREPAEDLRAAMAPSFFADPAGGNITLVSLALEPGGVEFRQEVDRQTAHFILLAAVFDERGAVLRDYRQDYRLALDEPTLRDFQKDGATLDLRFSLPPGRYQVKTVVLEVSSGRMGVQRSDLEVPSMDALRPQMSSIVLSRQSRPIESGAGTEEFDPLRLGNLTAVPSAMNRFTPESDVTALFHVYHVRDAPAPEDAPYRYRMTLCRDGAPFGRTDEEPVGSGFPHPLGGFVMAPRLSLSALPPGLYRLEIEILPQDGTPVAARSVAFQVYDRGQAPEPRNSIAHQPD